MHILAKSDVHNEMHILAKSDDRNEPSAASLPHQKKGNSSIKWGLSWTDSGLTRKTYYKATMVCIQRKLEQAMAEFK